MNEVAAHMIAKCVTAIAMNAAKIAFIDYQCCANGIDQQAAIARVQLLREIEQHERFLAGWLPDVTATGSNNAPINLNN